MTEKTIKRAEEALRESEERYHSIFDNARDGIVLIDSETGCIVDCNSEFEKQSGRNLDQLKKLKIWEVRPPEKAELAQERFHEIVKGGRGGSSELEFQRPDGEIVPVEFISRNITIGGKHYLQSMVRDITERKRIEAALKEAHDQLELRVQQRTTQLSETNKQLEQELHQRKRMEAALQEARDQLELRVQQRTTQLSEANEQLRQAITECKRVEEELAKLHKAVAQSGEIIFMTQLDGTITYVNPQFEKVYGFTPEEALDKTPRILKSGVQPPESYDKLWQTILAGQVSTEEVINKCKDGRLITIESSANPVFGDDGKISGFLAIQHDITERKRMEAALKEAHDQLELRVQERTAHLSEANKQLEQELRQRKRAEKKARQVAEEWRTTFDSISDLVSVHDRDYKLIRVNKAFADFFKMKPEELIGKTCYEVFHGTKEPPPYCPHTKTLETKEPTVEAFFEPYLGIHLEVTTSPVFDEQGQVIASSHIARDITERKRAEEEIRLLLETTQAISEAQDFNAALERVIRKMCQATDWDFGEVWVPSLDGKVLKLSPAWYSTNNSTRKFGQLSEEFTFPPNTGLPGRVWSSKQPEWIPDVSTMPKVLFPRAQIALEAGIKAGFGVPIIADGRVLAVLEFFKLKAQEENPRLVKLVSSVAIQLGAVIQRKQAEDALRKSQQNYKSLVDSIDGIVWEADAQTFQFSFVSKQAERLLGYPTERWLTEPTFWADHIHPDDRGWAVSFCAQATAEKRPHEFEYRLLAADGRTVWLRDIVTVVVENDRPVKLRGVMMDITEQKRAAEKEKELQAELYLASRLAAIGELAAGVAHEINNPLTGVIGFSERLLRKSSDKEAKRDLEMIHSEGLRMARVVENLLAFARRRVPKMEYANINDILQKALELRAYELKANNIEVNTSLAHALPEARVDFGQIQQVFLNIIINAEQVMLEANRGGKLGIKTRQVEGYIRITLTDDGPGISAEHLDQVFNPFFTTRGERGGTGLGLSVCHSIITEHNGRIYAMSQPGKGATFSVELPLTAKRMSKSEAEGKAPPRKRIGATAWGQTFLPRG